MGRQADRYRKWKRAKGQLEEVFRDPETTVVVHCAFRRLPWRQFPTAAPVGCEFVEFSCGAHRCAIPHC